MLASRALKRQTKISPVPPAVPAAIELPLGTKQASVGLRGFSIATVIAALWLALSLWLALPWVAELSELIGPLPAWLVIGGIALAPGFMNALQTARLLLRPRGNYLDPDRYPALTVLVAAYIEAANIAGTLRCLERQR